MKTTAVRTLLTLSMAGGMMLTGCKSKTPEQQTQQQYAIRNPDGSITNPDGSVTYPAGSQQAQQSSGAAQKNADGSVTYPANTEKAREVARQGPGDRERGERQGPAQNQAGPAAAPAAVTRTIASGTPLVVRITQTLSAGQNNVGDGFTGVLDRDVTTDNGDVVFPRGTAVSGSVVASKGRGRFTGAGDLGIELTSLGNQRISTTEYEKSQAGKGKRTAGIIGGGAGLGAIVGGLAGGGKGALIGGLAGAGAGTAADAYTGNKNVVIPSESVITFRLTAPVTVR